MLSFDIYNSPVKLRTPDQRDAYRTLLGSIFGILTFCLCMTYAGLKLQSLISLDDYKIIERS